MTISRKFALVKEMSEARLIELAREGKRLRQEIEQLDLVEDREHFLKLIDEGMLVIEREAIFRGIELEKVG